MPEDPNRPEPHELLAHAAWLRRLAVALLGPSPAVEDVVQETWTTALAHPPSGRASLRPWLRVVLHNLVRLHVRAERRRDSREQAAGALSEPLPSAEELLSRHQSLTRLAQLVAALEEPYRSTVLLCYGEELTPSEVAGRLGIPAGTVRWRLKQGLDRLRAEMDSAHGSRRAWGGLVSVIPSAGARAGLLLVSAKTKVTAAVAVVLLLAGLGAWWRSGGKAPVGPAGRPGPSGAELRRLSEQPAEQVFASVAGRVVDEQGSPVRATIAIVEDEPGRAKRTPASVMATAAPDGGFVVARIVPGRHRLLAAAAGYLPAVQPGLVLAAGDQRAGVELVLRKGGHTLSGRVLDTGGGSIGGARVRVAIDAAGPDAGAAVPMAVADAAGAFQVTLPRGRHGFVVDAEGYAPAIALVQVLGDQARDFRLNAAGQVSGRVVRRDSQAGEPGVLVRLECSWQGQRSLAETESEADGAFLLDNVEPGDCALYASKGPLAGRVAGGLVVEVAGRVSGLLVPLDAGRSVSGVVSKQGQPAPGVHVRLVEDVDDRGSDRGFTRWRGEVLAGEGGRFRLQGVLGGSYQLRPVGKGVTASPVAVTVADRDVDGLRLEVLPSSTISGLVTDAGGAAIAGAVATAEVRSTGAPVEMNGVGPVRSGKDGRFVLDNAGPGSVTVIVDHPTLGQAIGEVLGVAPGENRELTIRLGASRMLQIHGRVRWEGESPGRPGPAAPGLSVNGTVFRGNAARTTTGPDGRFVLGPFAPRTTVLVGVQHMPWVMGEDSGTTHTVKLEDADAREVEIMVPAADGSIRGSVLGPDGHPVPGASVLTRPGRADAAVISGPDGAFVLDGLTRGTYVVRAEHPGLPAAERAGVRTGDPPVVLRLPEGGRLEGTVVREAGGSGAPCAVWAVPVGPRAVRIDEGVGGGMARQWVSDPGAAFALGPLAPGNYHLYAVSPDGLVGHLPAISVSPGAARPGLRLQLRAGATLEGRVIDFLTRQPVAGARLWANPLGRSLSAVSAADGSYQLRGLVPGASTMVQVAAPGYNHLRRTVVTPPDGRTEQRLFTLVVEERGRKTPQRGAIGLVVTQDDRDRVVVRAAPPGLPASNGGLAAGDAILSIDGLDVTEIGLGGVVSLLRGDPGTPLVLRFQKPDGTVKEVRLVRV